MHTRLYFPLMPIRKTTHNMAPAVIAAIISGLASIGSAGIGAASSKNKNDAAAATEAQARGIVDAQRGVNSEWYKVKMSQDYTKRADAQAAIAKQRELLNERYRDAKATQAVTGGSDAELALQKDAANRSLAETMSNIAESSVAAKDNAEAQYIQNDNALAQQQVQGLLGNAQQQRQQANASAQAGIQGATAGINLIGTLLNKSNA